MVLEFEDDQCPAIIKVIGLGGAGCNAVDSMMRNGLQHVEFVVANTDKQALAHALTPFRIQMGEEITQGLGTGAKPEIGELAAQEAKDEIRESLRGADMIFIAAGLGGGTGTGSAPVVAEIAKEVGALTVAIVTKPFKFEGKERMKIAEAGAQRLKNKVDALMVIPNDHLLQVAGERTSMLEAFEIANKVLLQAVSSITDLINVPGLINVDFADIRTIIGNIGGAVMGIGIGKGDDRAEQAVRKAGASPLLEKVEIQGARRILLNVTGGKDISLAEVTMIADMIYKSAHPDAEVIFGAVVDPKMQDEIRVTVIATGFDNTGLLSDSLSTQTSVVSATRPVGTGKYQPTLKVDLEERKEDVPEFEPDGQMSLLAAARKAEEKVNQPFSYMNDWEIPAFLRQPSGRTL